MAQEGPRRKRVILGITGSVAAIKACELSELLAEDFDVEAVLTSASRRFVDERRLAQSAAVHTDEDEWAQWSGVGDAILHIELRRRGDCLLVAPLSANTMAKFANGLCPDLLSCVFRCWDFSNKPCLLAPAMNTLMHDHPLTERHTELLSSLGARFIGPISKTLACGDNGLGAMAEPRDIASHARHSL